MMTPSNQNDEIPLADIFRPLVIGWRQIVLAAAGATVVAAIGGALFYQLQPTQRTARVLFRPAFDDAIAGRYPNGLPFTLADTLRVSTVDPVLGKHRIADACPVDVFRSGLSAEDLTVTAVAPAGAVAVPLPTYALSYVQRSECAAVSDAVVFTVLLEILDAWAVDAVQRRGALNYRAWMLAPTAFDQDGAADEPVFVRAELARASMLRVMVNMGALENVAGAELVRIPATGRSLREVRGRIEDLLRVRLEPLTALSTSTARPLVVAWLDEAIDTAAREHRAAERKAEGYRTALHEYSITSEGKLVNEELKTVEPRRLAEVLNAVVLDRILQLSRASEAYRQELTNGFLTASADVTEKARELERYRALRASAGRGSGPTLPSAALAASLDRILSEAKVATAEFNQLHEIFSRTALRGGSALYRIERAPEMTVVRAFTLRSYVFLLIGVAFVALLLFAAATLALVHGRAFMRVMAAQK